MFMLPIAMTDEEVLKLVAVAGGILIAIVAIIFGSVKAMVRSKHTEDTRRELAAYVAEGSMTPDDAEKILSAGQPYWEKGCKKKHA